MEIVGFKVVELIEFVEGDIVDGSNMLLNGLIQVKDLRVSNWLDGCENIASDSWNAEKISLTAVTFEILSFP